MNTGSDDLFLLIKSLSKTEKRFFKLYSFSNKSEKNYLKLFDAIDAQKTYNEEAIKVKLKAEPFIKNLAVEKNHLYKQILKSLRNYSAEANVNMQLKAQLMDAQILYRKKLYLQSGKVLRKVKKEASLHGQYLYVLEAMRQENSIMISTTFNHVSPDEVNKHFADFSDLLDVCHNLNSYEHMQSQLLPKIVSSEGSVFTANEVSYWEEQIKDLLLNDVSKTKSEQAEKLFYLCRFFYFMIKKDSHSACTEAFRYVQFYKDRPGHLKANPRNYHVALNNLVICLNRLGRYDEMKEYINEIKKLNELISGPGLVFHIVNTAISELEMYTHLADHTACTTVINETLPVVKEGISKGSLPKLQELNFYFYTSYAHFMGANYKASNKMLYQALNDPTLETYSTLLTPVKILQLLIHYEQENFELIENIGSSLQRYFQKGKKEYQLELLITSILKAASKANNQKDRMLIFKQHQTSVSAFSGNSRILEYVDLISWLQSKIENKTFLEIMKEKTTS